MGQYLFTNPEITVRNAHILYKIGDSLHDYESKKWALQLAGEGYREMGQYPKSLDMQFRALRLNRQQRDTLGEAYSSSFLGLTLLEMEEYRSAVGVLIPAAREMKKSKDTIHYSFILSNIASCYTQMSMIDSAEYFNRQSIWAFQQTHNTQSADIQRNSLRQLILVRMGEMYEKMNLVDSANIMFRQVLHYSIADNLFSNGGQANVKLAEYFHFHPKS